VVFLAHVNCRKYDMSQRALYLGLMVRRLIQAMRDNTMVDNRDYYGNKRMKCAGQLMELVFEDKLKSFNAALSKYLKKELGKGRLTKGGIVGRDVVNVMISNRDIITNGLFDAIATVNMIS
jgi:DNA-directed RNA polymerase III subunit RPC2